MADDVDLLDAPAADAGAAPADKGTTEKPVTEAPALDDAGIGDRETGDTDKGEKPAPKARGTRTAKAKAAPDDGKPATGAKTAATKKAGPDDELGFEEEDEDGNPKSPATWPDDWREKLAAGNDKLGKRLARFASPEALLKSWQSLEQKLSSGEYKRAKLPEDASDEEKAEWRQANGIPDTPQGYEYPSVKGFEWSDQDKAIASGLLERLHKANFGKDQTAEVLAWYPEFKMASAEALSQRDREDIESREDALRTEWGPKDFRPQTKLAKDTFNDDEFFEKSLREALAGARTADGRRIIYMPEFTRFLAERGLERRGPAGLISGEQGARMGSRIDEIKKIRSTNIDQYYAEGLDKELMELMEKMESGRSR